MSGETYAEYQRSGLALNQFVQTLPPFRAFTQKKSGSIDQIREGSVGLDCRILDHAPSARGGMKGRKTVVPVPL